MTRSTPRPRPKRPTSPRDSRVPVFALNGAAVPTPGETRLWTGVAAALLGLFALASLYVIARVHRIGDYFTESDFYGAYAQGARLIQHGHLDPKRYTVVGPVYEVALALVGLVVRELFVAAELLSTASAVCTALLWFLLLRRRVDARLGAAALLFLCANDGFFRYAFSATTDAFGIALQSAALFALLGGSATPRRRRFAIAGGLTALAFLTRYNEGVLLPAGLIVILAGGAGGPRRGPAVLAFAGGFLLPVVPWVMVSLAQGGTLGTQLHHNIAYEVFARSKGIAWDDYQRKLQSQFPNLGAVIARDPGAVASRMLANVGEHLGHDATDLLGWPVAIAAVIGALLAARSGWRRPLWPVFATALALFLTLVPVFYSERYSLALLPAYATLAGAAFASPLLAFAVGRDRRVWLKTLVAALVVGLTLPAAAARQARVFQQLPVEVLDVGRVLRSLRNPGDRVISRKAHIAYYGDCAPLAFPFADSLADLARYAHQTHARWLYMSWPEGETRPRLYYLLDTTAVVPGLTVRYSYPTRPAVLYEIGPDLGLRPAWMANDTLSRWHTMRGWATVERSNPKLYASLGILSWLVHRPAEARDALRIALALDPRDAQASLVLGQVDTELRDYDGAGEAFGHALELQPNSADARVGYGFAAFMTGRSEDAATAWRPVIGVTAEPRILRAMAQLYDSLGNDQASREARARLATLSPR